MSAKPGSITDESTGRKSQRAIKRKKFDDEIVDTAPVVAPPGFTNPLLHKNSAIQPVLFQPITPILPSQTERQFNFVPASTMMKNQGKGAGKSLRSRAAAVAVELERKRKEKNKKKQRKDTAWKGELILF